MSDAVTVFQLQRELKQMKAIVQRLERRIGTLESQKAQTTFPNAYPPSLPNIR
jgi:cell division protein FtsB